MGFMTRGVPCAMICGRLVSQTTQSAVFIGNISSLASMKTVETAVCGYELFRVTMALFLKRDAEFPRCRTN